MKKKLTFRKFWWVVIILPILALALFLVWPLPDALRYGTNNQPIRILDRNGKLLYEKRQENFGSQDYLTYDQIPPTVTQAAVAIEDRDFFVHHGVSLKGIARAAWQNFWAGKVISGGSTITQQLVRNRLHPDHRDYLYKIIEALYALKLETRLNKPQILEAYLNSVYFGEQAYGIQAAASTFFDKNASELSQAESAFLVGLIQSPTTYDPFKNFKAAKSRQERVIAALPLTDDQKKELMSEPIKLTSGQISIQAPHFVMWVSDRLKTGGPTEVRTTLDLGLQQEVEQIVKSNLEKLKDKNVSSAAVVVLDAKTGDVLAMVGSADYFDTEHDGAVNVTISNRQPGSALKPFTYALALKQGATAASTVADVETQFFTQEGNPYIPRNYDYGYHGLVRYREALANSYNIPAVKVLEKVGVENLLEFLKKAGLTTLTGTPEHYGLALTLGDAEVKLIELAQAYGMLARGGVTLPIRTFLDDPLENGTRILDNKIAWLITDILSDNNARLPEFGESSSLEFDFPVAAKTGTTRNSRDNWTFGYTPERVVGVWVGNADNTPMRDTSGVTGAGPIFHDTMLAAMNNLPKVDFERPNGLVQREICTLSGKLPTPYCPYKMKEWFIAGTEPRTYDDLYVPVQLDTRNNLLASQDCPVEYTKTEVFTVFPPELKTWARENGWPSPPTAYSQLCQSVQKTSGTWLTIESPNQGDSIQLDPMIPDENEKIILTASASDNISEVEWLVDGNSIGVGTAPSFRLEWQPSKGIHQITARGNGVESKVAIEVIE